MIATFLISLKVIISGSLGYKSYLIIVFLLLFEIALLLLPLAESGKMFTGAADKSQQRKHGAKRNNSQTSKRTHTKQK